MTLDEAISPTSRALLSRFSGGGSVKFLTKNSKTGSHRTHVMMAGGCQPLCGGGNSARSAQWQEVFTDPDCRRCLSILEARKKMSAKKERACKRCGCTEDRACAGGCAWVAGVDVCTACLTGLENAVYEDLVMRIAASVPNARKQLKLFGQMILLAPKIKREEA